MGSKVGSNLRPIEVQTSAGGKINGVTYSVSCETGAKHLKWETLGNAT